ncbi:MAG: ABC transporter permease [Gammaproteobacteria bacterium]|nr:ABC transporter permease [Gammaproteobacteria bacterium]
MRRFLAVMHARNIEFLRDRSSLGWNVAFPVLLIFGLWAMFADGGRPLYKAGVLTTATKIEKSIHPFLDTRYTQFIPYADRQAAIDLVSGHELDILVEFGPGRTRYWVNTTSPKGYALERFLLATGDDPKEAVPVVGTRTRYIDWLIPGILGMNMMFSCLFGIGYVVVRYRKNGYLKRLHATPLTAFEYLSAQVVSRLGLVLTITTVLFLACVWLLDLRMLGSGLLLLLTAALGSTALIALGLTVAARVASEELAGGLLNLITWPMMLMSGVWFSMEGTSVLFQKVALIFPLTHALTAARAVMLDGAGLADIWVELVVLAGMSAGLMLLSAALFRWKTD